jgi:serine protease
MQQKWKCVLLGGAVLLSSALNCGVIAAEAKKPVKQITESTQEKVTRLIVKPRSGSGAKLGRSLAAGDASGLSMMAQANLSVVRPMSGGAHVLTLDEAVPLDEAKEIAARLRRDGSVDYAEPDRIIASFTVVPNDPLYNGVKDKQWHYFIPSGENKGGANLPNAWHRGYGAATVVAVLDTGHINHEDFGASTVITGYDFASYTGNGDGDGWDSDPTDPGDGLAANECGYPHAAKDDSWHGLHVTGTIAALMNNLKGGTGIAPDAQVIPVRVLGKCGGYTSDVADAMLWAAGIDIEVAGVPKNTKPAHVLNLSLGASGSCSKTFQGAVDKVLAKGKIIVAAAGNDGAIGISQPANCSGVLAVTAHTIDGDNADYSNIGTVTAISAPGGGCGTLASSCVPNGSANGLGVISTYKGDYPYAYKYGTSMATPHVSGVVAMMLQVHRDKYPSSPDLTPAEVRSYLQSSAAIHPDGTLCRKSRYLGLCGEGMLNADTAVQKVFDAAPTLSLDNAYQVVSPGTPVTLSGQGQTDSSYLWSQSYGGAVGLSGTTATAGVATAYFTAPASGVYTFQLDATRSGHSGKATATVRVNSAPSLTVLSSQSVVAGNGLSFNVGANDSDGDPISFHAVALPTGASLSADGTFYWSSAMPAGTHELSYYAMDDAGTQSPVGRVEIVVNSGGGGSGGGGGSLDWASLLVLGLLTAGWRWHRVAAIKVEPKR